MSLIKCYYVEAKKLSKKYIIISKQEDIDKYELAYNIIYKDNNEDNIYSLFYITNGINISYSLETWDKLLNEKLLQLDIANLLNEKNIIDILSNDYILFDYVNENNVKTTIVNILLKNKVDYKKA